MRIGESRVSGRARVVVRIVVRAGWVRAGCGVWRLFALHTHLVAPWHKGNERRDGAGLPAYQQDRAGASQENGQNHKTTLVKGEEGGEGGKKAQEAVRSTASFWCKKEARPGAGGSLDGWDGKVWN